MRTWIVVLAGALAWLEVIRPLRGRRENRSRHTTRNLAVAGLAAATVQVLEQPLVAPLARLTERRRWGLAATLPWPRPLKVALMVVALDYTLYLWHVLVHRAPFLWRFHAVHHVDLDLDASTAVRFHFGELALSVPWRAAQVCLIGVDPRTLTLWQSLTLMSVLFHHSNVRLPERLERALGLIFVTPRMHGIHHSSDPNDANANWSSGLSLWDRLHGTLHLTPAGHALEIGVAEFEEPSAVTLPKILVQPFRAEPMEA